MFHIRLKVFNQDISGGDKLLKNLVSPRIFQIQRDAFLIAMKILSVRRVPVPGYILRIALARGLNADHLGPPVGKQPHSDGSCPDDTQIEDADMGERPDHFGLIDYLARF